jgi:argininosuccinate synthase
MMPTFTFRANLMQLWTEGYGTLSRNSMVTILQRIPIGERVALRSRAALTQALHSTRCARKGRSLRLYRKSRQPDESDYDEIPRKALQYGAEKARLIDCRCSS